MKKAASKGPDRSKKIEIKSITNAYQAVADAPDQQIESYKKEIKKVQDDAEELDGAMKKKYVPSRKGKKNDNDVYEQQYGLKAEIEREKSAVKADKFEVVKYELIKDNELNLAHIDEKLLDLFANTESIEFSGLESATDLMFFLLKAKVGNYAKKSLIPFKKAFFNGCKYISILAVEYFLNANDMSIADLHDNDDAGEVSRYKVA
jgi:hypothetical protein